MFNTTTQPTFIVLDAAEVRQAREAGQTAAAGQTQQLTRRAAGRWQTRRQVRRQWHGRVRRGVAGQVLRLHLLLDKQTKQRLLGVRHQVYIKVR